MKFTKGIVLSLASLFIAVTLMGCDTNYAKKSTENTALLALLMSVKSKGTACGVEKYSGMLFINQIALMQGLGSEPWAWNDCTPDTGMYTNNSIGGFMGMMGTISTDGGPIVMNFTYGSDGKVTTITETANKVIAAGAAAATNGSGCPGNTGTVDINIDVVQTTEFTYGANGEVAEKTTYSTCDGEDNIQNGAVSTSVYTYNSDKRPVSIEVYLNLDYTTTGATANLTAEESANPLMVVDLAYTPASGVPTQVAVTQTMYQWIMTFTNAGATNTAWTVSTETAQSTTTTIPMDKGNLIAANAPTAETECTAAATATLAKMTSGDVTDAIGAIMFVCDPGMMIMAPDGAVTTQQAEDRGNVVEYQIGLDDKSRLIWFAATQLYNATNAVLDKDYANGTLSYDDQGRLVEIDSKNVDLDLEYSEKTLVKFIDNNGLTKSLAKLK